MKKWIALLLAMSMVFSLAACGAEEKPPVTTGGSTTQATEQKPTETDSAQPSGTDATEPPATQPPVTEPPATEPPHTHSYSEKVTAPTCTEKGYTTFTCSCGDTYKDKETAATGHKWSEWKTTKEPTETAEGAAERTCSVCKEKETKTLAKLTHTHSYSEKVTAPTCTEKGYTTYTCACGDSYKGKETAATGHKWSEWKTTKEPTETAEGEAERSCSVCKEKETKVLDKLPHTHSYTETGTEAPTCTAEGSKTYTCSSCKDVKTESIPSTGHSPSQEWIVDAEATCSSEGSKSRSCTVCGAKVEVAAISKKSHAYASGKCTVCGAQDPNAPIVFSGVGPSVVSNINLPAGTSYVAELVSSQAENRNFIVKLWYGSGKYDYKLLANEIGYFKGQVYLEEINVNGVVNGQLEVDASQAWEIRFYPVHGEASTHVTGKGQMVSGIFTTTQNRYTVQLTHNGKSNFITKIYELNGGKYDYELLTNEIGIYSGSVVVTLETGKQYFFEVNADGEWSIDLGMGETAFHYSNAEIADIAGSSSSGSSDASDSTPPAQLGTGLKFTLGDDGSSYILSGIGSYTDASLIIPSEYNGLPVTHIAEQAFLGNTGITSVTVPSSIINIGNAAFKECTNIQTVYTSSLKAWCKITFGWVNSNPLCYGAKLYINQQLATDIVIPEGISSIGNSAFFGCSSLRSVMIPEGVISIGSHSLSACPNLTSVSIPDTVRSIGDGAFQECTSLRTIMIPEGVTKIEQMTFMECNNLEIVTLPSTISEIGMAAFSSCPRLSTMYYNGTKEQFKSIPKGLIWDTSSGTYYIHCTDGTLQKVG